MKKDSSSILDIRHPTPGERESLVSACSAPPLFCSGDPGDPAYLNDNR